jgi:integrase
MPDGKRRYYYGKRREEVAAKLNEALRLKLQNRLVKSGSPTVKAYLAEWHAGLTTRGEVRPITLARYRWAKDRLIPVIGKHRLSGLTRAHIQACHDDFARRYAPRTMKLLHAGLRRALNDAVDLGLIAVSPALQVKLPRCLPRRMKTLTAEEARRLLIVAEGTTWRCMWTLMLSTGMRIGEVLALDWSSVDLVSRTVSVSAGYDYLYTRRLLPPKTPAARRSIPLSPMAVASLREHWRAQREQQFANPLAWQADLDVVFSGSAGQRIAHNQVQKRFKSHLRMANLPDIRIHDLRHTFATLCLERGANPKLVQQWMGHSSVAITMDTYSHVSPAMSLLVAKIMEDVLSGQPPSPTDSFPENVVQIDVKSRATSSDGA